VLLAPVFHNQGGAGADALALMVALFIVALVALYFALRIPRLPEYQPGDEEQAERR
jgi:hypothetical protein